jgi:hypothetical protein
MKVWTAGKFTAAWVSQSSDFLLAARIFITGKKHCRLSSLGTGSLRSLFRKCLSNKYLSGNKHSWSDILWSVHGVPCSGLTTVQWHGCFSSSRQPNTPAACTPSHRTADLNSVAFSYHCGPRAVKEGAARTVWCFCPVSSWPCHPSS